MLSCVKNELRYWIPPRHLYVCALIVVVVVYRVWSIVVVVVIIVVIVYRVWNIVVVVVVVVLVVYRVWRSPAQNAE